MKAVHPIARYDTKGSRLTCVAFADGKVPLYVNNGVVGKRKRGAVEDIAEEDEGGDSSEEGDVSREEEEHDEGEGEASGESSDASVGEAEEDVEVDDDGWGGLA